MAFPCAGWSSLSPIVVGSRPAKNEGTLPARRKIFGRLSISAGNAVQIAGIVAACLALAAARSVHSTTAAVIAMVAGWIFLYFCCHAVAHWVVGRILGIRFAYYTVGGTGNPEGWPAGLRWLVEHLPFLGVQTEKASMQRASPMARAIMWSAGVTSPPLSQPWARSGRGTLAWRGASRSLSLRCSGRPERCPVIGGAAPVTTPRPGVRCTVFHKRQQEEKQVPRLAPRPRQTRARSKSLAALPRDDNICGAPLAIHKIGNNQSQRINVTHDGVFLAADCRQIAQRAHARQKKVRTATHGDELRHSCDAGAHTCFLRK
jgi:hypothetical protein